MEQICPDSEITEIIIEPKESYILVQSNGNKDFRFAKALWTEIAKTCKQRNCYNVLGVAFTTSPPSANEAYQYGQLFKDLGIGETYRIAWVELNPSTFKTSYFVETVLLNAGQNVRLFNNILQAKKWLDKGGYSY